MTFPPINEIGFEWFDLVSLKSDPNTCGSVVAIVLRPGAIMIQVQWAVGSIDQHYPQEIIPWREFVK